MHLPQKYKEVKVLILGSYSPKNYLILQRLKQHLIDQNFKNIFIANDIVKIPEHGSYEEKMASVLSEIEKLMQKFDFNIFILFEESNNSTITELGTFIHKNYFKEKKETTLVVLPRNYNISMVVGLLFHERIKIFRYDCDFDIYEYCTRFIIQNSIYVKRDSL
ncbi:MAG: hypothetical protein ACTSYB_08100 [Candidatus Helarchaeota archaeon]